MPSITWEFSTLKNCIRYADEKTRYFTRQTLIEESLDDIVHEVKSVGKTPHQTLSRVLQSLRNYGVIRFEKRGVYSINDEAFRLESLLSKTRKMSRGERLVKMILDAEGFVYIQEKIFPDMRYKSYLRFDFYLELDGKRYAIEYDGKQHSQPIAYFGGEKAFRETQERDRIKNEYCKTNGISLLRVNAETKDHRRAILDFLKSPHILF